MMMKTIRKHLKLVSMLLSIAMLFQSCVAYHSSTTNVDDAIQSKNKVKLVSATDTYVFEELLRENGNIYGITKWNTLTAKALSDQIVADTKDQKNIKILLSNEQLNKIYLQNKTMSTLGTIGAIGIPVFLVVGGIAAFITMLGGWN